MTVPFVPDRFRSTVPFYRSYRLRYPEALVDDVAACAGLPPLGRVLDLGCGPGFLAIAFAGRGRDVLGIDPNEAMLDGARAEAAAAGAEVVFRRGSSYDLSPDLGPFDLVTMGRSFHWMDRPATLRTLDGLVARQGMIALFADDHERTAENGWVRALKETAGDFAGPEAFAHRRARPAWVGHVATLLDSPFSVVTETSVWQRRVASVEDAVGRGLSMSGTAPEALGDRRPAFEAAVRSAVMPFADAGGRLTEVVRFVATLARRPTERA